MINENFFDSWSADMAYVLGYIWSDGSLGVYEGRHKLAFHCTEGDKDIIENLKRGSSIQNNKNLLHPSESEP